MAIGVLAAKDSKLAKTKGKSAFIVVDKCWLVAFEDFRSLTAKAPSAFHTNRGILGKSCLSKTFDLFVLLWNQCEGVGDDVAL